MWSIVEAAGWPIWLIIVASVMSLAIILERSYSLRRALVAPASLLETTLRRLRQGESPAVVATSLEHASALGQLLAAGIRNAGATREIMKESIEDEGRVVALQLERFLTTLGTISAMAPLLGLLGTVVGMIELFGAQTPTGSNPHELAHGISVALYNTAFGLIVAIPSMIFYRYFRARVDMLLVGMESQAVRLVEALHGERPADRE